MSTTIADEFLHIRLIDNKIFENSIKGLPYLEIVSRAFVMIPRRYENPEGDKLLRPLFPHLFLPSYPIFYFYLIYNVHLLLIKDM